MDIEEPFDFTCDRFQRSKVHMDDATEDKPRSHGVRQSGKDLISRDDITKSPFIIYT